MDLMNKEFVLQFLEVYRKYAVIWDAGNINHKNRNSVSDAWNQLKKELSVDMTVDDLKKKKESLMTMYRTQKKKIAESKKSGAKKREVYKPTWFAFKAMDKFLNHTRQIRPAYDIEESLASNESEEDADHEIIELFAVSDTLNDLVECEVDEDMDTIKEARKPSISSNSTVARKRKPPADVSIERSIRHAAHALEIICKKKRSLEPERDECTLYGELVATRLKALNHRTKKIVINKIDNMIFSAEMEEYNLTPSPSSHSSEHSV